MFEKVKITIQALLLMLFSMFLIYSGFWLASKLIIMGWRISFKYMGVGE